MSDLQMPKEIKNDPFVHRLNQVINLSVKILSILMVLVILWTIVDVVHVMYQHVTNPPYLVMNSEQAVALLGDFLMVLIAIEVFMNIVVYLREDAIQIQLVVATALIAVARKVIILDYTKHDSSYIWATGVVILALGITYWLLSSKPKPKEIE